ncbi:uncharacterized protein DNG_06159 [Cephalotrichum gorgonifer]|uniref:gamma-glutamylcyclotransferase n=1 Tax=Cephalotrichum gorgonifer TaxID=2041049 RepID=A0AAE8MZ72_9PEZI|nr:uncharacterized protein DNG_06159 [Cephalotrichum gorgonifer]
MSQPQSQSQPQTQPPPPPPPTLYFAFGSNLWLAQMARRCPRSKFIGRAKLRDHRWQINERGYANVVPELDHTVEGLIYEIDEEDEARLDVNEGVANGSYSKGVCDVKLYPTDTSLYRRPTAWIVGEGGPCEVLRKAKSEGKLIAEQPPRHKEGVLVYIDKKRVTDGLPREEYIDRINAGVRDAVSLWVDRSYFETVVRPFVPERPSKKGEGRTEVQVPR